MAALVPATPALVVEVPAAPTTTTDSLLVVPALFVTVTVYSPALAAVDAASFKLVSVSPGGA
jgi:hypothetical protein